MAKCLAYDMLFRPEAGERLQRARIGQAPMSQDARELLLSTLAERRSERPASMAEVGEWLGLLADELP